MVQYNRLPYEREKKAAVGIYGGVDAMVAVSVSRFCTPKVYSTCTVSAPVQERIGPFSRVSNYCKGFSYQLFYLLFFVYPRPFRSGSVYFNPSAVDSILSVPLTQCVSCPRWSVVMGKGFGGLLKFILLHHLILLSCLSVNGHSMCVNHDFAVLQIGSVGQILRLIIRAQCANLS